MKLISLDVENFGVYSAEHFDFAGTNPESGFCLVHGPNEAGKTTLLQLVREVLFGFRNRNRYDFGNYSGDVAAKVRAELADGRRLRFRRRKGTKDRLTGEIEGSREPLDEPAFERLLAAGPELYEHVFGFSLEELVAGEKSLRDAGLTEALFGGGLGGLGRFRELRDTVKSEHEQLFKSRGRKPRINELLGSIAEAKARLDSAFVDPREYARLREEFTAAAAECDTLRDAIATGRSAVQILERSERALPIWTRRELLVQERVALEAEGGPQVAKTVLEEYERLDERLRTVGRDIDRFEAEVAVPLDNAASSEAETAILSRLTPEIEGKIRALAEDIGRMRSMAADAPKRRAEADGIVDRIAQRVREINGDWTPEDLDRFATTTVDRARLRRLVESGTEIRERDSIESTRLRDLNEQLERSRTRIEQLEPNPRADGLRQLLDEAESYRRDVAARAELTVEAERLSERIADGTRELERHVSASIESPGDLPVPLENVIVEAERRSAELAERVRQRESAIEELRRRMEQLEETLEEFGGGAAPPDQEQLERERRERDTAWQAIRRRHVENEQDVEAPEAAHYEQLIARADGTVDERFRRAEEAARREQLLAERVRIEKRLANAEEAADEARKAAEAAMSEWEQSWEACGFRPLAPTAMREWCHRLGDVRAFVQQSRDVESRLQSLTESIEAFEKRLMRGFRDASSPDEALWAARSEYERDTEHVRERRTLEAELPKLEAAVNRVDETCRAIAVERGAWDSQRRETMRSLGLPDDWDVVLAERVLGEVADLLRERDEAHRLRQRVLEMDEEQQAFDERVNVVAEAVGVEVTGEGLETLARLVADCDRAKTIRSSRAAVEETRRETARRLEGLRGERTRLEKRLGELVEEFGDTEGDVRSIIDRARQHAELSAGIADAERELRIAFDGAELARIEETLGNVDPDDVSRRLEVAKAELADVQEKRDRAAEAVGSLREKIEKLSEDNGAAGAAAELEGRRSELATAVDRWAPLVLVQDLISAALVRFEREHQPVLLDEVSRILARMTDGQHVGLERKLDNEGTLLVESADGTLREPSQLSTGAREQLYLAIRLAYALRYAEKAEPLPIVMDDVLVNFDEERARRSIEVLVDVAQRVQVLFLTCHRHVVEIVREVVPNLNAIELTPSGPVSGAAALVGATASEPTRGKRRPRSTERTDPAHPTLFPGS